MVIIEVSTGMRSGGVSAATACVSGLGGSLAYAGPRWRAGMDHFTSSPLWCRAR